MKKLFLYLSIIGTAILVFFVTFYASRQYFKDNSKKVVIQTTEELTTREVIDVIDYLYYNNDVLSYVQNAAKQNYSIMNSGIGYRLGIKNGYLVVYEGGSDNVYEYTDINVNILRNLNFEIYEKLDELEFNTKEELFIFLQSIES